MQIYLQKMAPNFKIITLRENKSYSWQTFVRVTFGTHPVCGHPPPSSFLPFPLPQLCFSFVFSLSALDLMYKSGTCVVHSFSPALRTS